MEKLENNGQLHKEDLVFMSNLLRACASELIEFCSPNIYYNQSNMDVYALKGAIALKQTRNPIEKAVSVLHAGANMLDCIDLPSNKKLDIKSPE